jgi:hypothetical protein
MKAVAAMFGVLGILFFLAYFGVVIVKGIQFDRGCEGYLKRAADANTVQMAKEQLAIAISYADEHNLTKGFTSVIYTTPDEDVGFWYNNLKASHAELSAVTEDTSQLEKTNILMKLRETLLDDGEKGTDVTIPSGISVFPNNMAYGIWGIFSGILALFGGLGLFIVMND